MTRMHRVVKIIPVRLLDGQGRPQGVGHPAVLLLFGISVAALEQPQLGRGPTEVDADDPAGGFGFRLRRCHPPPFLYGRVCMYGCGSDIDSMRPIMPYEADRVVRAVGYCCS